MKLQHAIFCNNYRRQAFTLVEVIASLMLLGTLLVGILTAHRRHVAQVRAADARLAAIAAADKLLQSWQADGSWGPASTSGRFPGNGQLAWRWTVTARPELRRINAGVGRLDVLDGESEVETPLLSIEILTNSIASTSQGPIR